MWYGRCGRDPKFGDERHILNCLYEGPPKRAPAADVDKARNSEFRQDNIFLYRVTNQGVTNLTLTPKQRLCLSAWASY